MTRLFRTPTWIKRAWRAALRTKIEVPETGLTIRFAPVHKGLGYFDPAKREIVVGTEQEWVGANVILLHELLHAIDESLVSTGITKEHVDHEWIRSAAPNLLLLLVLSGFWTSAVTKGEMKKWYSEMEPRP